MNKNKISNLIILSIIVAIGFITTILGIVSLTKHVLMGTTSIFDFNKIWGIVAEKTATHRWWVVGLGVIGLIAGIVTLITAGVMLFQTSMGASIGVGKMIIIGNVALFAIIIASTAMSFNGDLNSSTWLAEAGFTIKP